MNLFSSSMRTGRSLLLSCVLLTSVTSGLARTVRAAEPIGGIISYQGQLQDTTGKPLPDGLQSTTFTFYENGAAMGTSLTMSVAIVGGVFNTFLSVGTLSFDPAKSYELGIKVGTGSEVKHPIAAVPVALGAKTATTATNFTGPLKGDVSGTQGATRVEKIQGQAVTPVAPTNGQVLRFNSVTGQYEPNTVVGPQGETGATGPQGPIGATGATGPQGPVGATGAAGPMGPIGPTGQAGSPGAIGPVGPAGSQGEVGPIGPAGPVGPTGPIGPVGPAGPQGEIGATGPQGPTGATGPQGPTGATGPQGPNGPIVRDSTLSGTGLTGSPLSVVQNYVNLNGNQTINGTKTFTSSINTVGSYNYGGNRVLGVNGGSTFVGMYAGSPGTTGDSNLFVGYGAGFNTTTGNNNVAIGREAGFNWTTGSFNVALGYAGLEADERTMRLGNPVELRRTFIAGTRGVAVPGGLPVFIDANGQVGTSVSSSRRFKQDIANLGSSSNWLLKLRPVSFRYTAQFLKAETPSPLQYGLIAEEVAQVAPQMVHFDEQGRPDGVNYQDMPILLLNLVQQQQRTIAALQAQGQQQKNTITQLQAHMKQLDVSKTAKDQTRVVAALPSVSTKK